MTAPKFSQTLANFSGSLSANLPSSWAMRFVTPFRIAAKTSLFWMSSRDTLSGRSAESTTSRTKRSHPGRRSAFSVMSTRRT